MFYYRRRYQPAPGRGPELRALLVSRPWLGQGAVSVRLAGPALEGRVITFHDSLAALEQHLEGARASVPEGPLPFGPLLASSPSIEQVERLQTAPAGPPPGVVVESVFEFAPGKGRELRSLLEELAARRNAQGGRMGIGTRVSGGAPAHLITSFHPDLASVEKARATQLADPEAPARAQRLAALLARPADLPEIFKIVARFG